jgi:hypothetical protein
MPLSKSVNSYATVAEADAYHDNRLDVAAWTDAPTLEKEKALITATAHLDGMTWVGVAVDAAQLLAFPRRGTYMDPRLGMLVTIPTNSTPDRILKACYELAYHFLNNDGLLDDTGLVDDLEITGVKLTGLKSASKTPPVVMNLIKPLLARQGNNWWRAN